jgi:hypothetical protein
MRSGLVSLAASSTQFSSGVPKQIPLEKSAPAARAIKIVS